MLENVSDSRIWLMDLVKLHRASLHIQTSLFITFLFYWFLAGFSCSKLYQLVAKI